MRYIISDNKYHFKTAFDSKTGAYVRTGILDENGKDTGKDPFMASYAGSDKQRENLTDPACIGFTSKIGHSALAYGTPHDQCRRNSQALETSTFNNSACSQNTGRSRDNRCEDSTGCTWQHKTLLDIYDPDHV